MERNEAFYNLISQHGYSSLNSFCADLKTDPANMRKRLIGQRQKIEIGFMFKIANALHEPIEKVIEIFYPEEFKENQSLIERHG